MENYMSPLWTAPTTLTKVTVSFEAHPWNPPLMTRRTHHLCEYCGRRPQHHVRIFLRSCGHTGQMMDRVELTHAYPNLFFVLSS